MTFSKFNESTKPIFTELKLLDLFGLNTFIVSLFMYLQRAKTLAKIFIIISFCKMMIYITTTLDQRKIYMWNIIEQTMGNSH